MKSAPIAFLLFQLLAFSASAQDPSPIPDKPGIWSYAYLNDENTKVYARQFAMTPDEIAIFRQKLDIIVNVLYRNRIMANPKGIDPAVESRPLYPH